MRKFALVAASAAGVLALTACTRNDVVSTDELATASGPQRAATCFINNLFPQSGNYVRVADDGLTLSYSRATPGYRAQSPASQPTVEVSLFNNRGIGDASAGAFTALSFGDENDFALMAIAENCVFEAMPNAMNYELQPPLPAPVGYRSLAVIEGAAPVAPAAPAQPQ